MTDIIILGSLPAISVAGVSSMLQSKLPSFMSNRYKRSNSLYYSLALLVSKELICKIMFLRTLGLKTDGVIAEFVRRKETSEMETLIKDNRGKAVPKAKLDKDLIWKHIMPYHLQINHRKSQNAPNKRYLEPHLTITAIWEDYKPTYGHISYIVYLQVFQSENIRFYESSPDERDVNAKYRTHSKDLNGAHDRDACETLSCYCARTNLSTAQYVHITYTMVHQDQMSWKTYAN